MSRGLFASSRPALSLGLLVFPDAPRALAGDFVFFMASDSLQEARLLSGGPFLEGRRFFTAEGLNPLDDSEIYLTELIVPKTAFPTLLCDPLLVG